MRKLVSILALFMLVCSMVYAKTVNVSDTALNSINAAAATCVPGDTILLTTSGNYLSDTSIDLNGIALKGGTNPAPTITPNINTGTGSHRGGFYVHHGGSMENLKINFSPRERYGVGIRMWGQFFLNKLDITGGTDGPTIFIDPKAGVLNTGTIQYVTMYNVVGYAGAIGFATYFNDASGGINGPVPPATDIGPITINHCTITYTVGYCILLGGGWPTDGAEIEVKNSILGGLATTGPLALGIFRNNKPSTPGVGLAHHHNLYTNIWILEIYNGDTTGVVPLASLGEIGGESVAVNPFNDISTWDLKLKAYTSPALWKGDDGLHMGADVVTVPVELSAFGIE